MDFKFNFGASNTESGTNSGFKFNFGDDGDDVSTAADSLNALRLTPQGHFVAKEVTIEGKEEELDEMAIEALFEDIHFRNRDPLKRCRPPNSESLEGPIAEVIDKSDLASGVYEGGFKVMACFPAACALNMPCRSGRALWTWWNISSRKNLTSRASGRSSWVVDTDFRGSKCFLK
eukprot:746968-Hanusia_phi.AAC.6